MATHKHVFTLQANILGYIFSRDMCTYFCLQKELLYIIPHAENIP